MKTKRIISVASGLVLLSLTAPAQLVEVTQNGSSTLFDPGWFAGSTLEQLYDYHSMSYHGHEHGLPTIGEDEIVSFFVQGDDGLGFFTVFGENSFSPFQGDFSLIEHATVGVASNVPLSFVVTDDPIDLNATLPGGYWNYSLNLWSAPFGDTTDGFVLAPLDGSSWSLTMTFNPILEALGWDGKTINGEYSWKVLGWTGSDWMKITDLDTGFAATFAATPEPATIAFMALGALGTIAVLRRRKIKQ